MRQRHDTVAVRVGEVTIGGGAPIVVQAMTDTPTADVEATTRQCLTLAEAGAEVVRVTVNSDPAAQAVPEIHRRLRDAGCPVPLVGDFHYNGHRLLSDHPDCAAALDKYRINPGNVGRDSSFATICAIARDLGKAVRIGVNSGSLDQQLVMERMRANADGALGLSSQQVLNQCMVLSALDSTEQALACGLAADRIVISCKVTEPCHLIEVYRELAAKTRQPLHLGLTEAGMGTRGVVWSAAAMGVLLAEGIGDTIRVSLTPRPGGDRREEVRVAEELLQALGLRAFAPSVTVCPGCGRTSAATFRELAVRVEEHVRQRLPEWRRDHPGVEWLRIAVMGCIVNGPGESRAADIGISLPGSGETPRCPVFTDGRQVTALSGDDDDLARQFLALIDDYVARRYRG